MRFGTRLVVGIDADAVGGARVRHGLRGAQVQAVAREALPAGAVAPSPTEPNLAGPAPLADALARLGRTLASERWPATIVLPDAVARFAILEPPAGTDPAEFARFQLAGSLPYPGAEARVSVLPLGRSRVLAAAVRRSTIQEYEGAIRASGLRQHALTLACFAALAGLGGGPASGLAVLLGDSTTTLLAFRESRLVASRLRRRDGNGSEPGRLAEEVWRTAGWAGLAAPVDVVVVGEGAGRMADAMSYRHLAPRPGWPAGDRSAEGVWFGAVRA